MERRFSPILLGCALVILALVSYVPALSGGFVFDDSMYVLEDEGVTETAGIVEIWSEISGPGYDHQYYPLSSSVWWLQWRLWGANPVGYHVVNVLLHGLCAVLLWRVLTSVRAPGAWLAGVLFAVHPLHVVSVAWVSELKNVLSCCLMLGSLLAFCTPETGERRPWGQLAPLLGWALFIAALLSKTATASLPVALGLLLYYRDGRVSGRWWCRLGLLAVVGLCAVGVTSYLEWVHRAGGEAFGLGLGERVRVASAAVWFYAAKLAWPWGLSFVYPRWDPVSWPWWTWLYAVSVPVVVGVLWAQRSRIGRGPLCAVGFFVVAVAPVSLANVAYTRHSYVADHWVYWASLGMIALAAGVATRGCAELARRARGTGPLLAAATAMTVSLLGAMTWQRSKIFESPRTLWTDTLARNPGSSMAHYNLGGALWAAGETDPALAHYREAHRLAPDSTAAMNNLATALMELGRPEEAEVIYLEALRVDPDLAGVHANLGTLHLDAGRLEEAATHFTQTLRLRPDLTLGYVGLAEVLLARGDLDGALDTLTEAVRLDPRSAAAHYNLALVFRDRGRLEQALHHLRKTAALVPDDVEVRLALNEVLIALRRRSENAGAH